MNDWKTTAQLSQETGISQRKIQEILSSGDIEISKLGNHKNSSLAIRMTSFNDYMMANRIVINKKK